MTAISVIDARLRLVHATVLCDARKLCQAVDTCGLVSVCCLPMLVFMPSRSNDAFDATTGVDGDKPESVVNLTGNRAGVLALANAFLAAGGLLLWRSVSAAVCMLHRPTALRRCQSALRKPASMIRPLNTPSGCSLQLFRLHIAASTAGTEGYSVTRAAW